MKSTAIAVKSWMLQKVIKLQEPISAQGSAISKTSQRRFGAEMTRGTHEERFRAEIMRFGLGRNVILALRLNV